MVRAREWRAALVVLLWMPWAHAQTPPKLVVFPPPALLSGAPAKYTTEAREAGLQGSVILYLEVDPTGEVRRAEPIQRLGMGLDESAVAAVLQWRYAADPQGRTTYRSAEIKFGLEKPNTWTIVRVGYRPIHLQKSTFVRDSNTPVLTSYSRPDDAACKAADGPITVRFEVGNSGKPERIEVVEDQGEGSWAPVVEALSKWRYRPGTINGNEGDFSARVEMGCANGTPAVASAAVPPAEKITRVGGGVTAPVPIYRPEPDYSQEARAAKLQGTVVMYVEVDANGHARNLLLLRRLGMGLDEKAFASVSQWRFRPGQKDGHPVAVAATIEVNFKLL